MTGLRRVVTGHSADGKAVFASDEQVAPISVSGASTLHPIWAADGAPTFPDDGSLPPTTGYWPPVGGFRYLLMTIAPGEGDGDGDHDGDGDAPRTAGSTVDVDELNRLMPGLTDVMEPDEPGMHTSDTVDLEIVVSGEITLELDDGVMKTMGPGDAIIQNGTRHRWRNLGREPARVAVILIGSKRSGSGGPA
jgi:mannose-6-phosphate isomerase-like protein (cupin superfamily)